MDISGFAHPEASPSSIKTSVPLTRWSDGYRAALTISSVFAVPAALSIMQVYVRSRVEEHTLHWRDLVYAGSDWLIVGFCSLFVFQLGKIFPFSRPKVRIWILIHLIGALAFCAAVTSLLFSAGLLLHTLPSNGSLPRTYLVWMLGGLPFLFSIYFALLGCVHAFTYFVNAKRHETAAARLAAQLSEAELRALRMQLNPHFLFNSLNALSALVRDHNTAAATRMLELIADELRHVLRPDRPNEVPLSEEVAFVARYLAIEQVRFSDRLEVRWDIQENAMQALVPSLIMQPIVENAVKYGVVDNPEIGSIEISAQIVENNLQLKIRNDGPSVASLHGNLGIGLSNTMARLESLYGSKASLSLASTATEGTQVTLTIPLRSGAI